MQPSVITPVGLDLSLTSTGYSCGEERLCITTKLRGPARLDEIATQICERILLLEHPLVIVEGYSFASRNSQAHSIGELGGVVRVSLWRASVPYVEVPPTTRAKFATGKGNASKGEVLSAVSARTGITWSGSGADDICDAFILEEIGLTRLERERYSWPTINRSALEKIDWTPLEEQLHKE